jgi:hypothetical protein
VDGEQPVELGELVAERRERGEQLREARGFGAGGGRGLELAAEARGLAAQRVDLGGGDARLALERRGPLARLGRRPPARLRLGERGVGAGALARRRASPRRARRPRAARPRRAAA